VVVLGGIKGGGERRVVRDKKVSLGEEFEVVNHDLFLRSLKRKTGFSREDDTEGLAETDEQTGG
jgi:hypothetical protein